MSLNFTVNTLILAKKYDSENLNKSDEKTFDPNQFQILGQQKSEWTEEKTEREMRKPIRFKIIKKRFEENTVREMQKPIGFEINKKQFEELTKDIYNNQDNNDFKTIINKRTYDLENAKKIWMEVTTRKNHQKSGERIVQGIVTKRH